MWEVHSRGEFMDAHFPCRRVTRSLVQRRPGSAVIVTFSMFAIALGFSPVDLAAADTAGWCTGSLRPADVWNTLTVDMSMKRAHISTTGATTGVPSPAATYRIERSSRSGSW